MPKRILQGTVVSDKNEKTVVVKVERRYTHPVMKKTVPTPARSATWCTSRNRSRSPRTSAGSSSPNSRRCNEIWKAGEGEPLPKNEEEGGQS
jgi:small subunit ribosomal protein S17